MTARHPWHRPSQRFPMGPVKRAAVRKSSTRTRGVSFSLMDHRAELVAIEFAGASANLCSSNCPEGTRGTASKRFWVGPFRSAPAGASDLPHSQLQAPMSGFFSEMGS
jgi:hypothetical protein